MIAVAGTPGRVCSDFLPCKTWNFSCASPAGARLPVHFSLAAIACAVFTHTAMAQEAALQETVATATRTESRLDATLADVTVITRAQLDAVGPGRSVAEVLQRLAGVQLSSNGGRGQARSASARCGQRPRLLLVDGVRYGSANTAAPVLADLRWS